MRGWTGLSRRLSRPDFVSSGVLLGLDFDGTLSDLVESPERATLAPSTRRLLQALVLRPDVRVAVLSGRALEDLRARVGLDGIYYGGNHGLEIRGPGIEWIHPRVADLDDSIWRPLAEDLEDIPGALLERKRLGAAVHYRRVPKRYLRRLAERVRARVGALRGSHRILRGKKTLDVRSLVDWNKGHALEAIRSRLTGGWAGVLVGDDRTDEEGFATLGDRALTIRVGRPRGTAAQFVLSRRAQVDRLLEALNARPLPRMN